MSEQNVFHFERPESFYCTVFSYTIGHKNMYIRLKREDSAETIYVLFGRVIYYSGPFAWKGANFQVADQEEYLNLIKSLDTYKTADETKLLTPGRGYRLYYHLLSNQRVLIIAGEAQISEYFKNGEFNENLG